MAGAEEEIQAAAHLVFGAGNPLAQPPIIQEEDEQVNVGIHQIVTNLNSNDKSGCRRSGTVGDVWTPLQAELACSELTVARCSQLGIISCYRCDDWRYEQSKVRYKERGRPKRLQCTRIEKGLKLTFGVGDAATSKPDSSTGDRILLTPGENTSLKETRSSRGKRKRKTFDGSVFLCLEDEQVKAAIGGLDIVTPPRIVRKASSLFHTTPKAASASITAAVSLQRDPVIASPTATVRVSAAGSARRAQLEEVRIRGGRNTATDIASPRRRKLDRALRAIMMDEATKDRTNGSKGQRRIDLTMLAAFLWSAFGLLYAGRWLKTRAKALVQVLFRVLLVQYPELFEDIVLKETRMYLRRQVFRPWKFQRTMDLYAAGSLNYEAMNSIRSGVEELPKHAQGVIPSGSTVARYARLLESHASVEWGLSIKESQSKHGPTLYFDSDIYLRMILDGYQLTEYAVTGSTAKPVLLAHTLDGAQLTNQLGHVTGGVKIVDPRAKDPISGMPLIASGLFQSRDLCYAMQITFGRDCKQLYADCFKDFHDYFNGGLTVAEAIGLPELSNFMVLSPQDLSSIWKTTGLGGGSASTNLFCYCCMCRKDFANACQRGSQRCSDCVVLDLERCFCHAVNDEEHLDQLRVLLSSYIEEADDEGYSKLDRITKSSSMDTNPTQADRSSNPSHLHFEPRTTQESKAFNKLLRSELLLRIEDPVKLAPVLNSPLEERRQSLLKLVTVEEEMRLARNTLERHKRVSTAATKLAVEEATPCILHLEMRVNEKLFHSVLSQGNDRYQDGDSKTKGKFVMAVTEAMNAVVLGDAATNRVGQWKFPFKAGKQEVQTKSMTGATSRKCVMGLKTLATIIFGGDLDQRSATPQQAVEVRNQNAHVCQLWHSLIDTYTALMVLLKQKEDFTESQINEVHLLSNRFMCNYIDLFAGKGITNYIHIIGACHLVFYLRKYGNLYKFSQQGWEALNQKLKHFYFNNTNHGGCGGNKSGSMITGDHVRPLMRMCLRFLLWKLGIGDAFFQALEDGAAAVTGDEGGVKATEELQFGEL